ncbi:transposase [Klebsiella pneumoniae]|nr:transposase [Klebsiella pneumoniae]
MPAFEWVHVQLHQQKGMISLSPPTICNSADLFELPFWVLVEAADADVTDALTVQGILLREMCQEEIYDP